jgi:hypothetical protein
MAREWTDRTAKKLFWGTGLMVALCMSVVAGWVAAYRGLWKPPQLGPWAHIALWAALAVSLLFAMDRGIPREGTWGPRLYWMRRLLLASVFATIAVMVYLK